MVVFSQDETFVSVSGHRYKAVDSEMGKCEGCAFKDRFGCSLTAELHTQTGGYSRPPEATYPRCEALWRKDSRSIIWVLAAHCDITS